MRLQKITGIPFLIALKIIFLIVLPIGAIHTFQTYQVFKKGILSIETEYVNEMKSQLKLTVDNIIAQFELQSALTDEKIRAILKGNVDSIHTMVEEIVEKHPSILTDKNELSILKDSLRSIRFRNGKGYYFAFSLDGTQQVYPPDPGREGITWHDVQDIRGRFIVRDMIAIATRDAQGYYTYDWPKPGAPDKPVPKLAYVKVVEPLNWIIGTGAYLDDMDTWVQSDVLSLVEHLELVPEESVFIMDRSGRLIANRLPEMMASESERSVQSLLESARNPGGGYLWFPHPPRPGSIAPLLSYSRSYDTWGWTVSHAMNNEKIKETVAMEKEALKNEIIHAMTTIFLIIAASICAIHFIGRYFRKKVENSFNTFFDFFRKASQEYAHIDTGRLPFSEFETLAVYANNMVDERMKKEAIIRTFTLKLKQANRQLKKIASRDGLTGVANRRYFDEVLQKEWARAIRNNTPISLGMIDIDFFKIYNDTFGHQQGDACLKKVAKALAAPLKRPADFLARYGGEEFVVILPETESEGAITIAEEMQAEVAKLNLVHTGSTASDRVTFSMGITTLTPKRNAPAEALVERADKALYLAKSEGRNRYRIL